MTRSTVMLLLCLGALPAGLVGQDSVRLRFTPPDGLVVHRVFQRHQRILTDPGATAGRVQEVAQLGGITQAALQAESEQTVVHLAFDSLRLRSRGAGEPWREVVMPGADTTWIQVTADERMRLGLRGGELQPGGGPLLLQLLTGLPGAVLPEQWIREGHRWQAELLASPSDPLIPGSMDDIVLRTRATFVVDSIVQRSLDTLAYVSVGGTAVQVRRQLDDGQVLAYGGSLTGNLVWSTGYMNFVSAATRLDANVEVRRAGSPDPVRSLSIETTLRQAVVP